MNKRALLAAFLLIASSGLALGQPVPLGPEFQVNTYTTSSQSSPSVAVDGSGNFVVVWGGTDQDASYGGVFGQRFDSGGAPLGGEFQINTFTPDFQQDPFVAVDASGGFVVVWESSGQDGNFFGVFGQRFDNGGAPLGGEFQVNTYTTGHQYDASLAVAGSGNFVVTWSSYGQDGSGSGIFGQRFDSAGAPLGGEFQVNTYTTNFQSYSSVALDGSGNFVVVWSSDDGSDSDVFGRRFDSAGAPLGGEFQINTYTTNRQGNPSVAVSGSGEFVVVWDSYFKDGSNFGVFGRRFDSAGAPLGGEFQVNTYIAESQYRPAIAMEGSGNFVVVWSSYAQDGSRRGVFGQRFDSAGAPLGAEFQINTYTTEAQFLPAVAVDGSGNIVVVWDSDGQDGSFDGVFGQRFGSSSSCSDLDGDGLCDIEDIVVTSPLDGGTLDCSDPLVSRPAITWSAGNYEKFRVSIASDPSFVKGTVVSSGDGLFSSTSYTPPGKKWKSACKKALAANPSAPELYIKVYGVDSDVPKSDPNRKTFSQVVRVDVTP